MSSSFGPRMLIVSVERNFYCIPTETRSFEISHDFIAFSGVMRLVEHLSSLSSFHNDEEVHIVVDAGTGTTAVGLALGAVCLGCVH